MSEGYTLILRKPIYDLYRYQVYWFRSGVFKNKGDGGFINVSDTLVPGSFPYY